MAFDFPSAPTAGQAFSPVPGVNYTFDGTGWAYSAGNTAPLNIVALVPAYFLAGAPDRTMRVRGFGFITTSIVYFDGVAMPTIFASGESLEVLVPSSAQAGPKIVQVTVKNGTTESNALALNYAAAPTLASTVPDTISIAAGVTPVQCIGTNFIDGSTVLLNFQEMPTTFVSATQLIADVTPLGTPGDSLYIEVRTGQIIASNQLLLKIVA